MPFQIQMTNVFGEKAWGYKWANDRWRIFDTRKLICFYYYYENNNYYR